MKWCTPAVCEGPFLASGRQATAGRAASRRKDSATPEECRNHHTPEVCATLNGRGPQARHFGHSRQVTRISHTGNCGRLEFWCKLLVFKSMTHIQTHCRLAYLPRTGLPFRPEMLATLSKHPLHKTLAPHRHPIAEIPHPAPQQFRQTQPSSFRQNLLRLLLRDPFPFRMP